jgi:5-methylcytosine-specific restriction endonuclease McrA
MARKTIPRQRREQILKNANNRCTRCPSTDLLEIHHIIEITNGGSDDDDNVMVLCFKHHMEEHGKKALPNGYRYRRSNLKKEKLDLCIDTKLVKTIKQMGFDLSRLFERFARAELNISGDSQ